MEPSRFMASGSRRPIRESNSCTWLCELKCNVNCNGVFLNLFSMSFIFSVAYSVCWTGGRCQQQCNNGWPSDSNHGGHKIMCVFACCYHEYPGRKKAIQHQIVKTLWFQNSYEVKEAQEPWCVGISDQAIPALKNYLYIWASFLERAWNLKFW